jgi:hypothetical protein
VSSKHRILAGDNAVGRIIRGTAKLIEFPGRTRHVEEKLGPIEKPGTLDGEVIQIGGRDETINVHLKAGEQIHICVTSKAIARSLAPHIFSSAIRVRGFGTWARLESCHNGIPTSGSKGADDPHLVVNGPALTGEIDVSPAGYDSMKELMSGFRGVMQST